MLVCRGGHGERRGCLDPPLFIIKLGEHVAVNRRRTRIQQSDVTDYGREQRSAASKTFSRQFRDHTQEIQEIEKAWLRTWRLRARQIRKRGTCWRRRGVFNVICTLTSIHGSELIAQLTRMSLGLYSNVWLSDNNPHSGSRRVNIKVLGGVPSIYQHLSRC